MELDNSENLMELVELVIPIVLIAQAQKHGTVCRVRLDSIRILMNKPKEHVMSMASVL